MRSLTPKTLFAFTFLIGVAAAVYFLIRGVERGTRQTRLHLDEFGLSRTRATIHPVAPVSASFLIAFGFVGFLLTALTSEVPLVRLTIATAAGLLAGLLSYWLIARSVRYATTHDAPDERFLLQGHLATVVRVADGTNDAEIEYALNGQRVLVRARPLTEVPLEAGSDVVIERLDEGIAYVEPWERVEERL
jgi:membrane protein implicated in regulation of membrane protease activity